MSQRPVRDREELLTRLRTIETALLELGVRRMQLFGSFARDEATSTSDVDLLVEFGPSRKTFDNYLAVVELLQNRLGRRVELVTTEALSPHLGPHITAAAQDVLPAA